MGMIYVRPHQRILAHPRLIGIREGFWHIGSTAKLASRAECSCGPLVHVSSCAAALHAVKCMENGAVRLWMPKPHHRRGILSRQGF